MSRVPAWRAFFTLLLGLSLRAQTPDPQAVFNAMRSKVEVTVLRATRFTCVESMERRWYANEKRTPPSCATDVPRVETRNLIRSDRLRLDVGVGSGEEMFSWAGQKAFQTDEIDKLVTAGPVNSGTFFAFLSSIFLEGRARINYEGLQDIAGKQIMMFGYSVPISRSTFETRTESGEAAMGYHGEFTVDPSSKELKTLRVFTDQMPDSVHICAFNLDLKYSEVNINAIELLLPSEVTMDVIRPSHNRTTTTTVYGQCREFRADSALVFGSNGVQQAGPSTKPEAKFPPGLHVQIRVVSSIRPRDAWAGDEIQGQLVEDMTDEGGRVLLPKGIAVQGRLLRLETWYRPARFYTVALQFSSLQFAGKTYRLTLRSVPPLAPVSSAPTGLRQRVYLENPQISDDPKACRFRLTAEQVNLKGTVTYWVTE